MSYTANRISDDGDAEFADRVCRIGAHRPRLKSDGKPMRALRALAETTPTHPMTWRGVWQRAAGRHKSPYWAALNTLVDRGLAERSGVRGEYMWHITREGLDLLTVEDANGHGGES